MVRWQRSVERADAGEAAGVVPGDAHGHRAAAIAAGDEDSLRMDIEAALGGRDAVGDSRFGALNRIRRLVPVESAANLLVRLRTPRGHRYVVAHSHERHDLAQLLLAAGITVKPNEQRVRVSFFVVNWRERGERRIRLRIGDSPCTC